MKKFLSICLLTIGLCVFGSVTASNVTEPPGYVTEYAVSKTDLQSFVVSQDLSFEQYAFVMLSTEVNTLLEKPDATISPAQDTRVVPKRVNCRYFHSNSIVQSKKIYLFVCSIRQCLREATSVA